MYSSFPMASYRTPGQRAGLTRSSVVSAARELAEREGLERLSMRALAAELGVMPNALYSHVEDKDELLDALLDDLLAGVETPAEQDWRPSLETVLVSTREVLLRHPRLIQAFLTRPTRGPNALRLGEYCLEQLERAGLHGEQRVRGFRALLIFALGFAAYEAPRRQESEPERRTARSEEAFRGSGHPRSSQAASELAQLPSEADFRVALAWMLDGLSADAVGQAK